MSVRIFVPYNAPMSHDRENTAITRKPENDAHFVADGCRRALEGAKDHLATRRVEIKTRIKASYASQMDNAGIFRRMWLNNRMSKEIALEMAREEEVVSPPDALY